MLLHVQQHVVAAEQVEKTADRKTGGEEKEERDRIEEHTRGGDTLIFAYGDTD